MYYFILIFNIIIRSLLQKSILKVDAQTTNYTWMKVVLSLRAGALRMFKTPSCQSKTTHNLVPRLAHCHKYFNRSQVSNDGRLVDFSQYNEYEYQLRWWIMLDYMYCRHAKVGKEKCARTAGSRPEGSRAGWSSWGQQVPSHQLGSGSAVSSSSRVWARAPVEIEFGAFWP